MISLADILGTSILLSAAVLIELALSRLIRIKERWYWKGAVLIACYVSSMMIIYVGDWFNFTASMVIFLFCVRVSCEGSNLKKMTMGLMFVSILSAFNGFFDVCIGYLFYLYAEGEIPDGIYPGGRFLFALILLLGIRSGKWEKDFELSSPYWRLMLFLNMPPLGILLSLLVLRSPFMRVSANILSESLLFLIVIFSFGTLLWALSVLEKQQRLERESFLALCNRSYYDSMEEQQFEIRRLRHDLTNHLQILLALPDQEKNTYIEGMMDNPAFVRVLNYCGDSTINAVLSAKEGMMRKKGIGFHVKADIPEELSFEKADLCAIFANALDNAAEGCMGAEPALREVSLDAKAGKGVLAVSISNSLPKNRVPENVDEKPAGEIGGPGRKRTGGLLKTTKKDTLHHGFGLRSIQEAVKKYGGNMEIRQQEEKFTLFFYLPLNRRDKD